MNTPEIIDPFFSRLPTAITPDLPFLEYQKLPGINASILKEATSYEMLLKLVGTASLPTLERQLAELEDRSVADISDWVEQYSPQTTPRPFARLCGAAPVKTTEAQEAIIQRLLAEGEVDCREFNAASLKTMIAKGFVETTIREVTESGVSESTKDGRLKSFAIGDALHKSILEPHYFDASTWQQYWQLSPTKSLASDAAQKAFAEDPSRALITPEIIDAARRARDAVQRHALARELLSLPGRSELTINTWDGDDSLGINRKARIDRLPDDPAVGIIDIKTTRAKVLAQPFKSECYKLGYHIQLAYYADTLGMIENVDRGPRYIIAVTNHAPYICRVFDLAEGIPDISLLAKGRDIYQERLAAFQLAYHTNTWEAYENEGAFALTV